jgi:anti-sigma regulatory factor (Ser/Thr protein kinase)
MLSCGPTAPRRARIMLRPLAARLPANAFEDLLLLTSELVANCVAHGGAGRIRIRINGRNDLLRLEVECAKGASMPHISDSRAPDGGLRLRLLDRLSSQWGIEDHGPRTTVWFEMPTSGDRSCQG